MQTQAVALLPSILTGTLAKDSIIPAPKDQPPASLPVGLLEKIKELLPKGFQIEEFGIFKKREALDPIIAIKIAGQWFSLYSWE